METEWIPQLQNLLNIETEALPIIWDADFLYGPKTAAGGDTYILCEINVSSVHPFPESALSKLEGAVTFLIRITMPGAYLLFTEHHPDEFEAKLCRNESIIPVTFQHSSPSAHTHDYMD